MNEKTETTGTTTPETTPTATTTEPTTTTTTETTTTPTTTTTETTTTKPRKTRAKKTTPKKASKKTTPVKKSTKPKAKKTTKTTTTDRTDRTPRIKAEAPTISEKLTNLVKAAKTGREKRRILALGLALKGKVSIEEFRAICVKMKCYNSANYAQDITKEISNGILSDSREKIKGHRARRTGFSITSKGKKLFENDLS